MKRGIFIRVLSLMITLSMVIAAVPTAVFAADEAPTALYIIDEIGGSTTMVDVSGGGGTTSGEGWSWDSENNQLVLSGFDGEKIQATGDLEIVLEGENTITVADESEAKGIEVSGVLSITKTTSDTADKLTITSENTTTTDSVYGIYTREETIMSGGTLDIKFTSEKTRFYGMYASSGFIQSDGAVVSIDIESKTFVYGIYGSIEASGSGATTVEVANKAETNYNGAYAVTSGGHFYGSGDVLLSATIKEDNENGRYPAGFAIEGAYKIEPQNGAKVTTKGIVAALYNTNSSSLWVGSKTTVAPANYILSVQDIGSYAYHTITDVSGNLITDMVFTGTGTVQPLSYTPSALNEVPATKVGDYKSVDLTYGLKGAGSENQRWTITEGTLPAGLNFWYWGSISGTVTAPCEAGSITVKVEVGSGDDMRTLENIVINYGEVVEPDKFLTINDVQYNVKEDAEDAGANWSYKGDTQTLTLSGYDGEKIVSESSLNIVLEGENTITVADESDAKGIEVSGVLSITKTTSDTADKLTITSENTTTTDSVYGIYTHEETIMSGGTLDIKFTSEKTRFYGMYVSGGFIQSDGAVVSIDIESKNFVYGIYGSIETSGSGATNINIVNKAETNYNGAYAVTSGGHFCGSGDVLLSATIKEDNENGRYPAGFAIEGAYKIEPQNGAKVTTKGIVAALYNTNSSSLWVGSKTTVTPANYILSVQDIGSYAYHAITDVSGNLITDMVFTGTDAVQSLSYTASELNDLPAGKVGDYSSIDLTYGLKGAGSENQRWTITEGTLPAGLNFWHWGSISGSRTTPCEAGSITVKVEVGSGDDIRTLENIVINYGAVSSLTPVTGVNIVEDELIINQGEAIEPTLEFTPAEATYTEVTWTTEDDSIAREYEYTSIRGISPGVTTATAKTKEGGFTDSVTVYVREQKPTASVDALYIYGLGYDKAYMVNGEARTSDGSGRIEIEDAWRGNSISIVKVNAEPKCNSEAQVISVAGKTEISLAAITGVTAPVDDNGKTTTGIATTTEGVTINYAGWVYKNGEEWEDYTEDTFEGGKEYAIRVTLALGSAYAFAEETSAVVNGKNATLIEKDGDNRIIYYSFGILKERYTVTVNDDGNGSASATPLLAESGTEITLSATADSGYHFKEWQVVSGEITIEDNKFTMPESNVEIKAVFEENPPETYTVTVESYGNGSATATPNVAIAGTEIELTALPNTGYHFKEWEIISGEITIEDNKFVMPESDVVIKVLFEENTYTVTVESDGNGTASATPLEAKAGEEIILSATANEGYHFKEWQIVSGDIIIADNRFVMPAGNVEVKAVFEANIYTVTAGNDGHGTATATPSNATAGEEITLSAIADEGYHFKKWEVVSGDITIEDDKFTMPLGNVEVKAVFEADTYTVTVQTEGGGNAAAIPSTAAAGEEITLAVTVSSGYRFKEWQVVSGDVTIVNNKFIMPSSDVVIKAVFEEDEVPGEVVSAIGNYEGKVNLVRNISYSEVIFTVSAVEGTISDYSDLQLFVVEYNSDGTLKKVVIGTNIVSGDELTINAPIPVNGKYKIMLWDEKCVPVVDVK